MAKQLLFTQEILKGLLPVGSQDGKGLDATVTAKLFSPYSNWTWFILEGDPQTGELFTYTIGLEAEYGYNSREEIDGANEDAWKRGRPQPIERDSSFRPCSLREALQKNGHAKLIPNLEK